MNIRLFASTEGKAARGRSGDGRELAYALTGYTECVCVCVCQVEIEVWPNRQRHRDKQSDKMSFFFCGKSPVCVCVSVERLTFDSTAARLN